jgi:hypothetical protein
VQALAQSTSGALRSEQLGRAGAMRPVDAVGMALGERARGTRCVACAAVAQAHTARRCRCKVPPSPIAPAAAAVDARGGR